MYYVLVLATVLLGYYKLLPRQIDAPPSLLGYATIDAPRTSCRAGPGLRSVHSCAGARRLRVREQHVVKPYFVKSRLLRANRMIRD